MKESSLLYIFFFYSVSVFLLDVCLVVFLQYSLIRLVAALSECCRSADIISHHPVIAWVGEKNQGAMMGWESGGRKDRRKEGRM